ncbi:MAG: tetratricopeptide repeat protein [Flammeovirgaceae bacterium]|nr:MAG: tetratricopeptide repeat protein [Flammeovirgaceae bacterium]
MNSNLHDIDLIQRYLDRSLTDAEKVNLEERLKNEPLLKTMYLEHQQLIKGIRYSYLQNRLHQLRTLENALPQIHAEKKARQVWLVTNWKQVTAVAATVAFFAIGFVLWNKPATPQELFAENFKLYPNVFEPITRGETQQSKRTVAFAAYEAGNYTEAAALFTDLLAEKEEAGMLMLLGNCNLVLGNTAEARNQFIKLINDFDDLDNQAKWYLGLSYLKEGDAKTAQLIFQELSNSEYSYSSKAKQLLNKLD